MKKIALGSKSTPPETCIFCRIRAGTAPSNMVYEDAKYIAFLDAFPFSRGHTLVCPKEHGETIWDMSEGDIAELFQVASRVSKAVVTAMDADGFRFVQNNGEAANQDISHVHVHVIPVRMADKAKIYGRKNFSDDEMRQTAEAIRAEMERARIVS